MGGHPTGWGLGVSEKEESSVNIISTPPAGLSNCGENKHFHKLYLLGVLSGLREGLRHLSQPKATPCQTAKPEFRDGLQTWPKSSHSQQGSTQRGWGGISFSDITPRNRLRVMSPATFMVSVKAGGTGCLRTHGPDKEVAGKLESKNRDHLGSQGGRD